MMDIAFFDTEKLTKTFELSGYGARKVLAVPGLLSDRTISSAFAGEPISRKKASILVQRLNESPNQNLVAIEDMLDVQWMLLAAAIHKHFPKEIFSVSKVLAGWRVEGHRSIEVEGGGRMPVHPEYIYRISKNWTSWNDLFGVTADDAENYAQNEKNDYIEAIAWGALNDCLSNSDQFVEWWFALDTEGHLKALVQTTA